jgi:hypothetical protein
MELWNHSNDPRSSWLHREILKCLEIHLSCHQLGIRDIGWLHDCIIPWKEELMKGLWPLRPSQPPMATSDTRPACASGAALPRSSISAPPRSSSPPARLHRASPGWNGSATWGRQSSLQAGRRAGRSPLFEVADAASSWRSRERVGNSLGVGCTTGHGGGGGGSA